MSQQISSAISELFASEVVELYRMQSFSIHEASYVETNNPRSLHLASSVSECALRRLGSIGRGIGGQFAKMHRELVIRQSGIIPMYSFVQAVHVLSSDFWPLLFGTAASQLSFKEDSSSGCISASITQDTSKSPFHSSLCSSYGTNESTKAFIESKFCIVSMLAMVIPASACEGFLNFFFSTSPTIQVSFEQRLSDAPFNYEFTMVHHTSPSDVIETTEVNTSLPGLQTTIASHTADDDWVKSLFKDSSDQNGSGDS